MSNNNDCPALREWKFADATVDFAFKRIFGTEKYKAATISLLNSIITDRHIVNVSFPNKELVGETSDSRKAEIDVICEESRSIELAAALTGDNFVKVRRASRGHVFGAYRSPRALEGFLLTRFWGLSLPLGVSAKEVIRQLAGRLGRGDAPR